MIIHRGPWEYDFLPHPTTPHIFYTNSFSLCTLTYTSCPPKKSRRAKALNILEKSFTSIIVIKVWDSFVGMLDPNKNEWMDGWTDRLNPFILKVKPKLFITDPVLLTPRMGDWGFELVCFSALLTSRCPHLSACTGTVYMKMRILRRSLYDPNYFSKWALDWVCKTPLTPTRT